MRNNSIRKNNALVPLQSALPASHEIVPRRAQNRAAEGGLPACAQRAQEKPRDGQEEHHQAQAQAEQADGLDLLLRRLVRLLLSSCPICFSADNISVDYHGKRHVCVKCRKLMRDQHGNQIRIFLNEMAEIVCLGFKILEKKDELVSKIYYYTDYTRLEINGRSAFATFAKPDEMVVILRNMQSA